MEVSASGYYVWRKRLTKLPCLKRKRLVDLVRNCYFENRRRYGARRIQKALGKTGTKIGRSKVRVLMTEEGLTAIQAKAFKPKTTDSKGTTAAPNLLANIRVEECAAHKIIIGERHLYPTSEAAGFVIWQSGRIRSPDESLAGV